MSQNIDIIVKAIDEATATLKRIQWQIKGIGTESDKTNKKTNSFLKDNEVGLKRVWQMSTVAFAGFVALGTAAVTQASKMQDLRQRFDTLTGSAEKGKNLFMEIQKMATLTPFTSADLSQATSTMLGFGVAQDKVLPIMKQLWDISLWNADRFQRLSLAFAQVSAAGRLTWQDLLQMVNAGFNPLQEIAKKTGETMLELKQRMSDWGISVAEVQEAMASATAEWGRFEGGMEKASKTFSWVMSTLRDNIGITLAALGWFSNWEVVKWGVLDTLTKAMTAIMPYLDKFVQWTAKNPEMTTNIVLVTGALLSLAAGLTGLGVVITYITPVITAIGAVIGAISVPVWIVIWVIAALTLAWTTNFGHIQEITKIAWDAVIDIFNAFSDLFHGNFMKFGEDVLIVVFHLFDNIKKYFPDFYESFSKLWEDIENITVKILARVAVFVIGKAIEIANALQKMKDTLKEIVTLGAANTQTYNPGVVDWARAKGWPVNADWTYLVGENWPELFRPRSSGNIIPNDQIWGWSTVQINLGWITVNNRSDADYLVEELARRIQLGKMWIA